MTKLRQWLKMLLCRITGGHKYKDTGLASCHDPFNDRFWFSNRCVKCGHYSTWDVPAEAILGEVHRHSRFCVLDQKHADNRVEMHTVKHGTDGDSHGNVEM